MVLLLW
jgi:hypothetical protein